MSASAKLVSMRISDRSCAILISVGVWKLAATVWPISTTRSITTPSTGERITVKLTLARSRSFCARASASCARADFSAC